MELRGLAVLLGLCLLAVSQCTDARHSVHRREADYDDSFIGDEANDEEDSVQDAPAIQAKVETQPKTYEIPAGKDTRLECRVEPDNGTVVQWFQNQTLIFLGGIKLGGNDRYVMTDDSKDLFINAVEPGDAATYRCEVPENTEPVPSVQHTLVVLEAPVVYSFTATNDGNVIEGADVVLTCKSKAKPAAKIIWSRSGDGDDENERLKSDDGVFTHDSVRISGIKREQSGHYYCYAFNNIGNHQAVIYINVLGKPQVHLHKTVINSAINVEAVLQCSIRYEDSPTIRWYKDGSSVEGSLLQYEISTNGTHSNLTITPTKPEDFGVYTCEAENYFGKHSRSIELVQKPIVEALEAASGKLSWTVHSHQPLQEITAQVHYLGGNDSEWKDISIPLPSDHHHKYDIAFDLSDKVDQGKYEAIVKVKNDHSWSDAVEPIVFDIEVEPQLIQHASVYSGNSEATRPAIVLSTMMMYLLVRLL